MDIGRQGGWGGRPTLASALTAGPAVGDAATATTTALAFLPLVFHGVIMIRWGARWCAGQVHVIGGFAVGCAVVVVVVVVASVIVMGAVGSVCRPLPRRLHTGTTAAATSGVPERWFRDPIARPGGKCRSGVAGSAAGARLHLHTQTPSSPQTHTHGSARPFPTRGLAAGHPPRGTQDKTRRGRRRGQGHRGRATARPHTDTGPVRPQDTHIQPHPPAFPPPLAAGAWGPTATRRRRRPEAAPWGAHLNCRAAAQSPADAGFWGHPRRPARRLGRLRMTAGLETAACVCPAAQPRWAPAAARRPRRRRRCRLALYAPAPPWGSGDPTRFPREGRACAKSPQRGLAVRATEATVAL